MSPAHTSSVLPSASGLSDCSSNHSPEHSTRRKSTSALRAKAETRPALTFQGSSSATSVTAAPIVVAMTAPRSGPLTVSNASSGTGGSGSGDAASADSASMSSLSGVRRFRHALVIRLRRLPESPASGWLSRSSTTATRKNAKPPEPAWAMSRLEIAWKSRRPRPPAPMIAAMPSIEMASSSVWLRPVMIAGRAKGS